MMGNSSRHEAARELARYVSNKIYGIQREYVTASGSTSQGRATVARLRRDLDGRAPAWMLIGDDVFTGWPESLRLLEYDSEETRAARAALGLYALHQQSRKEPVAQSVESAQRNRMTFGRACRRIEPNQEKANGVLRRLHVAEAAQDFDGIVRSVRPLIMLMKNTESGLIQIDYRDFVKDLYLVQFPENRIAVFQKWGRDYFIGDSKTNEQPPIGHNKQ